MQERLREVQLKKKEKEYREHQELNEQEIAKASRDIIAERLKEKEKRDYYDKELKKMLLERKEQKKLDAILMLSTLSPGGKMQWASLEKPRPLRADDISNPFIEKSDIVNHKKKIAIIDKQRDDIHNTHKKQPTFAQYEAIKKDIRDQYFEAKAQEAMAKHDFSN